MAATKSSRNNATRRENSRGGGERMIRSMARRIGRADHARPTSRHSPRTRARSRHTWWCRCFARAHTRQRAHVIQGETRNGLAYFQQPSDRPGLERFLSSRRVIYKVFRRPRWFRHRSVFRTLRVCAFPLRHTLYIRFALLLSRYGFREHTRRRSNEIPHTLKRFSNL